MRLIGSAAQRPSSSSSSPHPSLPVSLSTRQYCGAKGISSARQFGYFTSLNLSKISVGPRFGFLKVLIKLLAW